MHPSSSELSAAVKQARKLKTKLHLVRGTRPFVSGERKTRQERRAGTNVEHNGEAAIVNKGIEGDARQTEWFGYTSK